MRILHSKILWSIGCALSWSAAAQPAHKEAGWQAQVRQLEQSRRYTDALRIYWAHSAQGASSADYMARARLFDRMGYYFLAFEDRLQAAEHGNYQKEVLDAVGSGALALNRSSALQNLVKELNSEKIDSSRWPASLRMAWALELARAGRLEAAQSLLPSDSDLLGISQSSARDWALLHAGNIRLALGQSNQAVALYRKAMRARGGVDEGLLRLQVSRALYEQRQYSSSMQELTQLPRNSPSWFGGVIVGAWAAYLQRDYNLSLGQLMTVHSPFLKNKFAPESHILEAASFFQLCHYASAARSLKELKSKYAKFRGALGAFESRYQGSAKKVEAVLNYARGNQSPPSGVSADTWALVMDAFLQEDVVSQADRSLAQISRELRDFERLFPSTSQPLLSRLRRTYMESLRSVRDESYRLAAIAINRKLASSARDVDMAIENSLAIDVEINTKIRDRLMRAKAPSAVAVDFDAEIKKGYEFWPFEGEYWRDEVGSYALATTSVCGERDL